MEGSKPELPPIIRMAEGPEPVKQWAQVVWPTSGSPRTCLITQWPMHQLVIHWVHGANLLCFKPWSLPCRGCEARIRKRWLGFVGAYDPAAGRHQIMEITSAAATCCPNLLRVDTSYVNWRLTTWRMGAFKTARMGAKLLEPVPGSVAVQPIDYARVIYAIFGLEGPPCPRLDGKVGA